MGEHEGSYVLPKELPEDRAKGLYRAGVNRLVELVRLLGFGGLVLSLLFYQYARLSLGGVVGLTLVLWAFAWLAWTGAWRLTESFDNLLTLYGKADAATAEAKARIKVLELFSSRFRPTQEAVDEALKEAALRIVAAHENHTRLFMSGLGACPVEGSRASLVQAFQDACEFAQDQIQSSKSAFQNLHSACKEQGYLLKKTWQEYADLPMDTPQTAHVFPRGAKK